MTRIADLTWAGVEARLSAGAAAILPIGAAAKEHGLHLPMNTDQIQAEWLAEGLASEINALIWPSLTYGHYPAFRSFPGSVSLTRPTFAKLVCEAAAEIERWTPRRLYILDAGLSTIGPVEDALLSLDSKKIVHLKIHDGPRYKSVARHVAEQMFGSHADELETSRMLVIAAARVDMARAQATPIGPFDGPLTRVNAPSGSYGDPRLATYAKGRALLDAMLADLVEACAGAERS